MIEGVRQVDHNLRLQSQYATDARERMAKLDAALRANIGEPQQVPDTRIVGGSLEEYLLDEWVCVHCGRHGDSAASIAHEDNCNYVIAKAAIGEAKLS